MDKSIYKKEPSGKNFLYEFIELYFVTKNQITTLASYIVNEFHVNSNAKNIVEKD